MRRPPAAAAVPAAAAPLPFVMRAARFGGDPRPRAGRPASRQPHGRGVPRARPDNPRAASSARPGHPLFFHAPWRRRRRAALGAPTVPVLRRSTPLRGTVSSSTRVARPSLSPPPGGGRPPSDGGTHPSWGAAAAPRPAGGCLDSPTHAADAHTPPRREARTGTRIDSRAIQSAGLADATTTGWGGGALLATARGGRRRTDATHTRLRLYLRAPRRRRAPARGASPPARAVAARHCRGRRASDGRRCHCHAAGGPPPLPPLRALRHPHSSVAVSPPPRVRRRAVADAAPTAAAGRRGAAPRLPRDCFL